jgi:hypothetical protein
MDKLNLSFDMIRVPKDELKALLRREAAQREALKKVLTFANSAYAILEPYNIEESTQISLIGKLPMIIGAFKRNQDLFKEVLNPQFMNELKQLTDEIPGE